MLGIVGAKSFSRARRRNQLISSDSRLIPRRKVFGHVNNAKLNVDFKIEVTTHVLFQEKTYDSSKTKVSTQRTAISARRLFSRNIVSFFSSTSHTSSQPQRNLVPRQQIPDIRRVALALGGVESVHEVEPMSLQLDLSSSHARIGEVAERSSYAYDAALRCLRQQIAAASSLQPAEDVLREQMEEPLERISVV